MATPCSCDTFNTEVAIIPSGFGGSAGTGPANIDLGGAGSGLNLWRRSLPAFPSTPAQGDRFALYNPDGSLHIWSSGTLDLVTFTSAGNVGVGTTAPQAQLHLASTAAPDSQVTAQSLQIETSGYGDNNLTVFRYSDVSWSKARLQFARARGTKASPASVQAGDYLGALGFGGWLGGALYPGAAGLEVTVDGAPGASTLPGKLDFFTFDGGGTRHDLVMAASGNVGIGTGAPQRALDMAGPVRTTGILPSEGMLLSGAITNPMGRTPASFTTVVAARDGRCGTDGPATLRRCYRTRRKSMVTTWNNCPATNTTRIYAVDLNQARAAIDAVGCTPSGGWTDGPTVTNTTRVKAKHFTEIQQSIQTLWTGCGLGLLPPWSSGGQPGGASVVIAASHILASD